MADNTSHTDDRADERADASGADNRTPPPGIEVIGELPPGTPWWDAEELGFRDCFTLQGRLCQAALAATLIALLLAFAILPYFYGTNSHIGWFDVRWLFVACSVSLLWVFGTAIVGGVIEIFHPFYLKIRGNTFLKSKIRSVDPGQLAKTHLAYHAVDLSSSYLVRSANLDDWFCEFISEIPESCGEVFIEIVADHSKDAQPSLRVLKSDPVCGKAFALNFEGLARLIEYRIAKAKGENPPPPEFS